MRLSVEYTEEHSSDLKVQISFLYKKKKNLTACNKTSLGHVVFGENA